MSRATVSIDPAGLRDVRNLLTAYRQGGKKALYRSINHGAKKGRTAAVDGAYKRVNLKKKDIRDKTTLYFASLSLLRAKLVIKGGPIPLIKFGARQTKKGVTFAIWRGEKREKYRHSFIAQLSASSEPGVYERDIGHPNYNGRLPLRAKRGPGIPSVYQNTPGLAAKAEGEAAQAMLDELDRQVGLINRGLL